MKIQKDKVFHFIAGFLISITGFIWLPMVTLGYVAGTMKEVYDYFFPEKHTCDKWDMIWTWIGAGIATILVLLIR